MKVEIRVELLPHFAGLELPAYQTGLSAGMDLRAACLEDLILQPLQRHLMPCGFRMALPPGYEAQVRPRSGLALRHGLTLINSPGTIDADYRGEVCLPLIHLGQEPIRIERGMRLAQMVVAPVVQGQWVPVLELESTERGSGGFGHTGLC
jgi:dUTP pyrophosphatase